MRDLLIRRSQIFYIVFALLSGLSVSVSYFKYFVASQIDNHLPQSIVFIFLMFIGSILVNLLLQRVLEVYCLWSKQFVIVWACIAAVLAISLIALQPQSSHHHLEIIAKAEKSSFSLGNEVWVLNFTRGDGSRVSPTEYVLDDGWKIQDGIAVAHPQKPARLTWDGVLQDDAELRLLKHAWSGIAEIHWDDQVQVVDLYTEPSNTQTITLNHRLPKANWQNRELLYYLQRSVIIYSVALLIFSIGIVALRLIIRSSSSSIRPFFRNRLWRIAFLLCAILPFIWIITPAIVTYQPHFTNYIVIYLYCTLLLAFCASLFLLHNSAVASEFQRRAHNVSWFKYVVWKRTRGTWLLGFVATCIVALGIIYQVQQSAQDPYAVWVRLLVDGVGDAPQMNVQYADLADDQAPVVWQPYTETTVALRRADDQPEPLRVLSITTDQGPITMSDVRADGARLDQNSLLIPNLNAYGAYLYWSLPTRAFTMTLASGSGNVELSWYDQQANITLGPNPSIIALHLPAKHQGWALVPAKDMDRLVVTLSPPLEQTSQDQQQAPSTYHIQEISLLQPNGQVWVGDTNSSSWDVQGCTFDTGTATLVLNEQKECRIQLPGVRSLRIVYWQYPIIAWFVLTFALFALLCVFTFVVDIVQSRFRIWKAERRYTYIWEQQDHQSSLYRAMWLSLVITLLFHFCYIMTIPIYISYDAYEYYQFAENLFHNFASIVHPIRTPGYPFILGIIQAICGDNALWIVAVQHCALALLAPLTVWSLVTRVPLKVATGIGILVGFAPAISTMASSVLTEALFTVFTTAAMLIYLRCGTQSRGILIVGMLSGVAAMIRPTAIVLMIALIAWLCLLAWCYRSELHRWTTCASIVLLILGYLVVVSPWYIHLALSGDPLSSTALTSWVAATDQHITTSELLINRPERALWKLPTWWRSDAFNLIQRSSIISTTVIKVTPGQYTNHVDNQTYLDAGIQEGRKQNKSRFFEVFRSGLVYGIFFKWIGDDNSYYFTDFDDNIKSWRSPVNSPPSPVVDETKIDQRMDNMAYRWYSPVSPMRNVLLYISEFPIKYWFIVATVALLLLCLSLLRSELRVFVPFYFYWFGVVAAYAIIGIQTQRYTGVCELMLYIVVGVGSYTLYRIVLYEFWPRIQKYTIH